MIEMLTIERSTVLQPPRGRYIRRNGVGAGLPAFGGNIAGVRRGQRLARGGDPAGPELEVNRGSKSTTVGDSRVPQV
jgi:hypothetical protein